MVAALPDHRELEKLKGELAEIRVEEERSRDRLDAKERELKAVDSDPEYMGVIARDRLNYYEPGEHVFRMEREK